MHVSIEQAVSAEELGLSKHPANHRQNAADLTLGDVVFCALYHMPLKPH